MHKEGRVDPRSAILGQRLETTEAFNNVLLPSTSNQRLQFGFECPLSDGKPNRKYYLRCSLFNFRFYRAGVSSRPKGSAHVVIIVWCPKMHSIEIKNIYFQSEPLDRALLLRRPRGGLPQVDPNAALLKGMEIIDIRLGGYEIESLEDTNFRYCGKYRRRRWHFDLKIDNDRKLIDKLKPDDIVWFTISDR